MKKQFILKRAVTYAVALAIAVFASYYFALSEKYWLILTTLFVMHTTISVTLRQGLQHYLLFMLAVTVGTGLVLLMPNVIFLSIAAVIISGLSLYCAAKQSLFRFYTKTCFFIGILTLIVMLFPAATISSLYARLYDVTLGAIIGIVVNLTLFPIKLDVEFRNNLIPLFQSYRTYLSSITNLLLKKNREYVDEARCQVEENLQTQSAFFPEWVYEKGLSRSLQPGYRHFLIVTERVGQILFSMQYLAEHTYQEELLDEVQTPLIHYTQQVDKIIHTLITILSLKIPEELVSDLGDELDILQSAFEKVAPLSIELLDVSPDYIKLAALIEDLRDLRVALIQLGRSVRFSGTSSSNPLPEG